MHSTRFIIAFLCFLFLLPAGAQTPTSVTPVSPKTYVRVLGLVHVSGSFEWHPGMRLLDALAISGGLSCSAEKVKAVIVRQVGLNPTAIDLPPLLNGTDTAQNTLLRPGDVLLFTTTYTDELSIMGAVVNPGSYHVSKDGITVLALLMQAGGWRPDAALFHVQVTHETQVKTYDLRLVANTSAPLLYTLRLFPGDAVVIPKRGCIFVSGAVNSPNLVLLPDGYPMTVADALAAVGGLTANADKNKMTIRRRVSSTSIERLLVAPTDQLKDGDKLIVPARTDIARPWLITAKE